jgi:predicted kinase
MTDCHVIVSGPFASGKTVTAVQIAHLLPATVVSKDLIKEALAEPLEAVSDAESLRLSGAAMKLLYAIASASGVGLVLEANWKPHVDIPQLQKLDLPLVQVFCHAPADVLKARINDRIRLGQRHPVHRDVLSADVLEFMLASLETEPEPLALNAPVYRHDTVAGADVAPIVEWIRQQRPNP